MSIKESALSALATIRQSDFIRVVTSSGASRKMTFANLENALTPISTGTIEKDSGISDGTIDSISLRKVGKTVFASARLHGISAVATGNFFVIPEGYRPQYNARVYGYMNIDGTAIPVAPFVRADGTVNFSYSSNRTTTQVYFSGSWPVV